MCWARYEQEEKNASCVALLPSSIVRCRGPICDIIIIVCRGITSDIVRNLCFDDCMSAGHLQSLCADRCLECIFNYIISVGFAVPLECNVLFISIDFSV